MKLTGKQRSDLRSHGNKLKPEIWIGKEGISEGTVQNLRNSFNTKDLVKAKLQENCPLEKEEAARILAEKTGSEIIQIIGNTILLFCPVDEDQK